MAGLSAPQKARRQEGEAGAIRVAILADIHGNSVALDAVAADARPDRPDLWICLGDVAAGGPQPRECLARLAGLGALVVMGNTDEWLISPAAAATAGLGDSPMVAVERWCAAQLSAADRARIATFAPTVTADLGGGTALLGCHGSPRSNTEGIGATTADADLDRMLAGCTAAVVACGHTHSPMVRRRRGATVFNPGTVGLQVAGLAEYALISGGDSGRLRLELRQVPYDAGALRRIALDSGMPHAQWWADHWSAG